MTIGWGLATASAGSGLHDPTQSWPEKIGLMFNPYGLTVIAGRLARRLGLEYLEISQPPYTGLHLLKLALDNLNLKVSSVHRAPLADPGHVCYTLRHNSGTLFLKVVQLVAVPFFWPSPKPALKVGRVFDTAAYKVPLILHIDAARWAEAHGTLSQEPLDRSVIESSWWPPGAGNDFLVSDPTVVARFVKNHRCYGICLDTSRALLMRGGPEENALLSCLDTYGQGLKVVHLCGAVPHEVENGGLALHPDAATAESRGKYQLYLRQIEDFLYALEERFGGRDKPLVTVLLEISFSTRRMGWEEAIRTSVAWLRDRGFCPSVA